MPDPDHTGSQPSTTLRLVTAMFGVFFVAIAIAIVVVAELTIGPVVAALVVGVLGLDAIVSAFRNTRSLLSRIGPLP